jgi:hypothetical protein
MNRTPRRRTLILFLLTCASTLAGNVRANFVEPVDVSRLAAHLKSFKFAPAAGVSIGEVDVISEEDFLTYSVAISAGGQTVIAMSTDTTKRGEPSSSDCMRNDETGAITCASSVTASEQISPKQVRCSQPVVTISESADGGQVGLMSLTRAWKAKVGESCADAEARGARVEFTNVVNSVSL